MRQELNPHEFPDKLNKHEYSVLELCEILHMSANGSGDYLCDKARSVACAELWNRLANWTPGTVASIRYDRAVIALIQAALAEQLV